MAPHELLAIRDRIDALDSELVPLLAARLALVVSAVEYKSDRKSVADPDRVGEVLVQVRARAEDCEAEPDALEAIYRAIIDEGIGLETIAYDERLGRQPEPRLRPPLESRLGRQLEPRLRRQPESRLCRQPESTIVNSHPQPAVSAADVESGHLLNVMATMRAMRRLDERPVAPELLDKLVRAASWAPVGANRQDYRFVIVTDRSQLTRLAPSWSKAMEFYLGALRPAVSHEESPQFERVRAAMTYQCQHFTRIPALIVVCREPVSFWKRVIRDPRRVLHQLRTLPLADRLQVLGNLHRWAHRAGAASVYPAVENLLLAARAFGLGATLTTWHSAFEKEFKTVLKIPRAVDIYAIVPVGYPLGRFGPVRRRSVEQLVNRERWRG